MKRGHYGEHSSDDDYTYDSDEDDSWGRDDENEPLDDNNAIFQDRRSATIPNTAVFALMTADNLRDDRPCLLLPSSSSNSKTFFDYTPQHLQADPVAGASMVTGVSPHGATLGTLEYNLRHAIESRDETRTAASLTEMFRHFVLLNMPMRRVVSPLVERALQVEMQVAIGPFANPAALGIHQKLFTTLVGICCRQVGIASPCAMSFVHDKWKLYEKKLFHLPYDALAMLLSIGAALCHSRKDASVAYARFVFEDNAKMREWRAQALKMGDVLATYMPSAEDACLAKKMLLNNKVYFTNRLRLRRYQIVCIGTPHPEYMCQGGCMARSQVLKLVDSIKKSIPLEAGPEAWAVVQDVEDIMIVLGAHVNNVFDRDVYETLQVDLQIYLYLLQKSLASFPRSSLQGPDALLYTSRCIMAAAPIYITAAFAERLWNSPTDMTDLIRYGVCGDLAHQKMVRGSASKKKGLTPADLLDTFQPAIIARSQETMPPSVLRDDNNIVRECLASEQQRHPFLGKLRFLFDMYRLHHMWSKCTSSRIAQANTKGIADRITVDREFLDIRQGVNILYHDTASGVYAAEVTLRGNAVAEIAAAVKAGVYPLVRQTSLEIKKEVISTADVGEAEILKDVLCGTDDDEAGAGAAKAVKAVIVGPFENNHGTLLEKEIQWCHGMKTKLGVEPDLAFTKKMMMVDFAGVVENRKQILGNIFTWVVYIPSLVTKANHVAMTIDHLKGLASQDKHFEKMAKAVLRPKSFVRLLAVIKRTCSETCSWNLGKNYVSFTVTTKNASVLVDNIRLHTITETLMGKYPEKGDTLTQESIRKIVGKCRTDALYAGANVELAKCENLLNQM